MRLDFRCLVLQNWEINYHASFLDVKNSHCFTQSLPGNEAVNVFPIHRSFIPTVQLDIPSKNSQCLILMPEAFKLRNASIIYSGNANLFVLSPRCYLLLMQFLRENRYSRSSLFTGSVFANLSTC